MTVEIETSTTTYADVDQAFSAREVPWMKMGKLTADAVTAAEAAKLGGIDFTVREESIFYWTKEPKMPPRATKIEGRKAIIRDDTDTWLGIVSADYPVVQYGEAFDFMDTVSPHFVAAGSLRKGRQAFMVVRAPEEFVNLNPLGDAHQLFATLRTSHDCSRAIEVQVMPLRGRCMNQLTLNTFRKDVAYRWTVTHTGDVKSKLQAAMVSIGNLAKYAEVFGANVKRLGEIKVTDEVARGILLKVLPDRPQREAVVERIFTGWKTSPAVGYEGTGWGLVNAVSEYFDWQRAGGTSESRFLAALEGQTHKAINKTAGLLLTRS